MRKIHIDVPEDSPLYQWAAAQADSVGARHHIGTHIDCYDCVPDFSEGEFPGFVLDCRTGMCTAGEVLSLGDLKGKALLFRTGNMENNPYNEAYFKERCFLSPEVLQAVLSCAPSLLLIDSHGISPAGKEHTEADRLCESVGCHVIENVCLKDVPAGKTVVCVKIDLSVPSSGKPCEVILKD